MRLHTTLRADEVEASLWDAIRAHKITPDVEIVIFSSVNSRSRPYGYDIQLGTLDKTSGPTKSRYYKNSGINGAGQLWAATYDEWGWFIAELMHRDPGAVFGKYKGLDSFNTQTGYLFVREA